MGLYPGSQQPFLGKSLQRLQSCSYLARPWGSASR